MRFKSMLLAGCVIFAVSGVAQAEVVYLDTDAGVSILAEAIANGGAVGYGSMTRYREPQRFQTYCGVASSIDVLNSLGIESPIPTGEIAPYNQFNMYNFFTKDVLKIKLPLKVQQEGIELDKLALMLNTFDHVTATSYHVGSRNWIQQKTADALFSVGLGWKPEPLTGFDQTEAMITAALMDKNQRVIINFHRSALGQPGGGHFSPAVAIDPVKKEILIADTASYKLPPVWVSMTELYAAMATEDSDGAGPGHAANRGFIIVKKVDQKN